MLFIVEKEVIVELRQLSHLSRRFNRIISIPLIAFLIANVIESVVAICLMQVMPFAYSMVFYLINTSLAMLAVATFDQQAQKTLKQIIVTLQQPKHQNKLFKCIFNQSFHYTLNSQVEISQSMTANTDVVLNPQSVQVLLMEMDIYLQSFNLRIFTLFKIDYTFILQTTLLVANTSVLIIQTSKK